MLVLSRKHGETICIGENIEITVLATAGNRVRIGIVAPRDVNIVRKELIQKDGQPRTLSAGPSASAEVCEFELNAHLV